MPRYIRLTIYANEGNDTTETVILTTDRVRFI
jgi:hypothetical protein